MMSILIMPSTPLCACRYAMIAQQPPGCLMRPSRADGKSAVVTRLQCRRVRGLAHRCFTRWKRSQRQVLTIACASRILVRGRVGRESPMSEHANPRLTRSRPARRACTRSCIYSVVYASFIHYSGSTGRRLHCLRSGVVMRIAQRSGRLAPLVRCVALAGSARILEAGPKSARLAPASARGELHCAAMLPAPWASILVACEPAIAVVKLLIRTVHFKQ